MSTDLRPALAVSVALHLSFLAIGLIAWPHLAKPIPTGTVTVKLVAQAPTTDVRPAIEAPEPAPAATPEPTPEAPPPEPAPTPPKPVPPPPVPPPPKPAPPKPAPPTPAPTPPPLDLDALASKLKTKPQSRLDLTALASKLPQKTQPKLDLNALAKQKPAGGAKGPLRPELAVQSRTAAGAATGLTADEASLLASKLNRLWNPNCGAEGASNVQVTVNIRLGPTGALASPPIVVGAQPPNPVWQAAAQRALSAVARGAPYDELPRDRYAVWKDINFNFNARQACGGV